MILKSRVICFSATLTALILIFCTAAANYEEENINVVKTASVSENKTHTAAINGEVKNEGSYKVDSGATWYDCIFIAGGVTDNADTGYIDFTQPVKSKCDIFVPQKDTEAVEVEKSVEFSSDGNYKKCNINKADKSFLKYLNGVGEKTAANIVDYRTEHGEFKSLSELLNVPGIGQKTYDKIKNYITLGGE